MLSRKRLRQYLAYAETIAGIILFALLLALLAWMYLTRSMGSL